MDSDSKSSSSLSLADIEALLTRLSDALRGSDSKKPDAKSETTAPAK